MLFLEKIQHHAKTRGHEKALSQKLDGQWQHLTWAQTWQRSQQIAAGLNAHGIKAGDHVAIMANNCIEWTLVDLAVMAVGAVSVPIYPTSSDDQIRYILDHSEAKMIFAEAVLVSKLTGLAMVADLSLQVISMATAMTTGSDQHTLANWLSTDYPAVEARQCDANDLLTIVYTSGTTGNPKGVMITHGNLIEAIKAHETSIPFYAGERSLAALPLSHIFERGWTYIALYAGGHNHYVADVNELQAYLSDVKPHVFCAVPRIFEKIHAGIFQKAESASPVKRSLLHWAAKRVLTNQHTEQQGQTLNLYQKLSQRLAQRLVGSKIKAALGGKVRFMPCGGAALDKDIHGFFMGLGINIKIGYGLTETLATVSFMPDEGYQLGTLGKPMTGIEIRVHEATNEILVRSPGMTPGYYKNPEATAELIKDGWLHTGDAGRFDRFGNLVFEERIKELMKTSGGKYIAPQHIEGVLGREALFEQVAVIADAKKYASALIVPAWETLEAYAHSLNIRYEHRVDLLRNAKILEHVEARLSAVQQGLARYEQIKKFTLLPEAFSLELEEITPTLKLRRKVITQRYQAEINAMY